MLLLRNTGTLQSCQRAAVQYDTRLLQGLKLSTQVTIVVCSSNNMRLMHIYALSLAHAPYRSQIILYPRVNMLMIMFYALQQSRTAQQAEAKLQHLDL